MRLVNYLFLSITLLISTPLLADSYNVRVPSSSSGSYAVTWTNSARAYHTLQERRNGGSWKDVLSSTSVAYKSFNKSVGGLYDYRIKHRSTCYRYCNNGPYYYYYSSTDTIYVNIVNGPKPAAPTNIQGASSDNDGVFPIWWTAPADNVDSYTVQQQRNGGTWTTVGSTQSTAMWMTNRSNGSYKYRVRSCNNNGCGSYSPYFYGAVYVSINTSSPVNIKYGYDELGRLDSVLDSKSGFSAFTYDDAGNRVQVKTNNDQGSSN